MLERRLCCPRASFLGHMQHVCCAQPVRSNVSADRVQWHPVRHRQVPWLGLHIYECEIGTHHEQWGPRRHRGAVIPGARQGPASLMRAAGRVLPYSHRRDRGCPGPPTLAVRGHRAANGKRLKRGSRGRYPHSLFAGPRSARCLSCVMSEHIQRYWWRHGSVFTGRRRVVRVRAGRRTRNTAPRRYWRHYVGSDAPTR